MFFYNSIARNVVVVLVEFKAYKVPFFLDASNSSSTAAHAIVKNNIAFICISKDKITQQINWFLSRMQSRFIFIKKQYICRVIFVFRRVRCVCAIVIIASTSSLLLFRIVHKTLRIVCALFFIEHADILKLF